jgi:hypothetical protein
MINVALSGSLDGGLTSGLLVLAGPSKHFKTSFMLLMAASYMQKYPDAVMLFYDSEFGSPSSYFRSFGIDTDRVFHTPITNVEQLKLDLINQLENLDTKDHVIVCIDSIGNTASSKELQDAIDNKSVTDMSRAKALKGLFRMVTPYLMLKDIPMIAVNHTYANMTGHGQTVSGGCLIPGSMVIMADGSLKPIEKIKVGEMVLTEEGPQKVTYTWNHETLEEGEPECYEVTFEDGSVLICSDSHRFMDKNGNWIYAVDSLGVDLATSIV